MSIKVKIFFAFLAVFALFSVLAVFNYFDNRPKSSLSLANVQSNFDSSINSDKDGDGLSDMEEAYWNTDFQDPDSDDDGFLDGEEVASGHDPSQPGPDDLINDQNITAKLTDLAVGGLIEGTLRSDNPDYEQALEDLTLSIVDDSLYSLDPKVDMSKILIVDSSDQNQKIYAQNIQGILGDFAVEISHQAEELQTISESGGGQEAEKRFIDLFNSSSDKFLSIYNSAILIPVPENWKDLHYSLVLSIKKLSELSKGVARQQDDPLRGLTAFTLLDSSYDEAFILVQLLFDNLSKEDLLSR